MDVARTLFALTAFLTAGAALAAPPPMFGSTQQTLTYSNQNDWSNVGPTTAPTISASPNDRYGFPQSNYQSPPSITARTQNAVNETATSLRDGFDAGVRAAKDGGQAINQQFSDWAGSAARPVQPAGTNVRPATGQTLGTTSSQSRVSSPFAPQPAPTATSRGGKAAPPPSWPTAPAAAPPASPQNWADSLGSRPAATGNAPSSNPPAPISGGWSSMGSSVAPPPLMTPQISPAASDPNGTAAAATIAGRYGPAFPTDQSARQQSIHSPLVNSSQQSPTTPSAADTWSFSTNNNPATPQATIGRNENAPPVSSANSARDFNSASSQPVAAAPQDAKKQAAKSDDWWADDPWSRSQQSGTSAQSGQGGPAATISATASKPAASTANNPPPLNQSLPNIPPANAPTSGSTTANTNLGGQSLNTAPPVIGVNTAKPVQPGALPGGDARPWVTLIAVAISLAGSLAANFFLGWSYLDARQKYQSLVRRTADTFRRTKPAAA